MKWSRSSRGKSHAKGNHNQQLLLPLQDSSSVLAEASTEEDQATGDLKGKKNDWCVREAMHGKGGPTIEGKGTYNCQGDWHGQIKWGDCVPSCVDGLKCIGGDS